MKKTATRKKSSRVPAVSQIPAATQIATVSRDMSLAAPANSPGLLSKAWQWLQTRRLVSSDLNRLKVAETVSLGEKRFVAVVQVDGRHFLLAGGPTNIALLAQLNEAEPFEDVLKKTMTVTYKKPRKRKRTTPGVATASQKTKGRVIEGTKPAPAKQTGNGVAAKQRIPAAMSPAQQAGESALPENGTRAFDKWLHGTLNLAENRGAGNEPEKRPVVRKRPAMGEAAADKVSAESWLKAGMPLPERPAPNGHRSNGSSIEEYA